MLLLRLQFRRKGPGGEFSLNIKGCMSVCKMFSLNLMKKCWLAPGRVLASSEENALDLTRFV